MAESQEIRSKHRRNLMVLSTLFFLYIATGTSVEDIRNIRVYFISAEVSRPDVLIYFCWLLLIWYVYRFWLSHRGHGAFHLIKYGHMNEQTFINNFLLNRIIKNNPNRRALRIQKTSLIKRQSKYFIQTERVLEINENTNSNSWSDAAGIHRETEISRIEYYFLIIRHTINVALSKSTEFWDSIFPYFYSVAAIFSGLWKGYC